MEQIIITHLDGSMVPLQSRGNASRITRATQTVQLLGNDTVDITVESAYKMTFAIGDKITIVGRDYTMNIPAKEKKVSANHFQYDLQFEGVQYDLLRATYDVNIDTTGSDIQGDSLTGDMKLFLDVLIANISQIFPGKWLLGTYPTETEAMTLTFGETDNCLSVLQTLCSKYNQEFDIVISANGTRTINIGQVGKTFGFTFQYGRGRGIFDLTRDKVSSSNIVTRLNVFGSTKNITSKYRSSKLCLPGKTKPQSFLEDAAAIAKYGVWKNTKNFDSIFPHRTGVVSALGNSVLKFIDTSMTFDLNEKEADGMTTKYLLSGAAAKVHFNTGNLAGYEFDIHSYDHATKTFKIKSQTDENDYTFPSESSSAFQIGVGDEYVLLDIALPQSYIDIAEAKLLADGMEYLAQNCQPKVQYSLTVDKFFLASVVGADAESNIFWVGDYIPIKDADIDVDKSIRIKGFTRDLMTDYSYSLTIADLAVTKSAYSRIISDLIDIDKIITINNLKDPARARRNYLNSQEVLGMVFDPEGDYYTDKIKPESVDTVMLSVGAKSMQFGLVGTVFQPNYGGNKNRIVYKGGALTHYAITDEDNVPRSWIIDDGDQVLLTDAQPYYIYARCEKNDEFGTILFSTAKITVESDPSYYHFWIGVINSVDATTNTRAIALTYGFTTVNGRYVKTGRVESADGTTYFDLDNSEIGGRIVFTANGSEKTLQELGQEALDTKNYVDNTLQGIISDIQAQLDGQIEQFFYTYDPTTANIPASDWTTTELKEAHLGDLFYNTTSGAVFRWIKNGTVYLWSQLSDAEVAQALSIANDALALAKTKRRIFTTTPTTPYEVGDLWVQGISGDIMRCNTTRTSGSYSSSDWEKASQYTSDAALNTFIAGAYADQVSSFTTQIDGKIESWFQESDPSGDWTTDAIKAQHVGDMWYNATAKLLKRYSTSYAWTTIEDKKAVDAYALAGTAKDTADGKRRVFITTPTVPYDIGDLWTDGTNLRRCDKAKTAQQSYSVNDWVLATTYDNTKTTIDGGIVTSGTIQVAGDQASILAGITGQGTADESVRFWAGASFENRATAPYRVLQDGSVIMSKATVEGVIKALSGTIGGFEIGTGRIGVAQDANGLSILASLMKFSDDNTWVGIGTNVLPATSGMRAVGRFENNEKQGFYETKSRIETYYSEADWMNAGSPEPAQSYYDEFDNLERIEVTVYYQEWVTERDSKGYGIIVNAEGSEENIAIEAIKGKIKSRNGGVLSWNTDYMGTAYTDSLELNIGKTNQFVFTSIGPSLLTVRLPASSFITANTSGNVSFILNITVGYYASNTMRLTSVTNGQLRDNNGNAVSYIDMAKGDTITLCYHSGSYYIISRMN
jgi:hypothetical protein